MNKHTKACAYYREKNGRCNCATAGKMSMEEEKTYILIEGIEYEIDKDGRLLRRKEE